MGGRWRSDGVGGGPRAQAREKGAGESNGGDRIRAEIRAGCALAAWCQSCVLEQNNLFGATVFSGRLSFEIYDTTWE